MDNADAIICQQQIGRFIPDATLVTIRKDTNEDSRLIRWHFNAQTWLIRNYKCARAAIKASAKGVTKEAFLGQYAKEERLEMIGVMRDRLGEDLNGVNKVAPLTEEVRLAIWEAKREVERWYVDEEKRDPSEKEMIELGRDMAFMQ